MKYEIKNRWTGELIYSAESDSRAGVIAEMRMRYANLRYANLRNANNAELLFARISIHPEFGTPFVGWKKCCNNVIVKLAIPSKSRRSNATGRKCRAEYVKVLEVFGAKKGISQHDLRTTYEVGKIVRCDNWNEDRWQECAGGIHFFITRIEAENY